MQSVPDVPDQSDAWPSRPWKRSQKGSVHWNGQSKEHSGITATSAWHQPISLLIEGASHSLHHFFGIRPETLHEQLWNWLWTKQVPIQSKTDMRIQKSNSEELWRKSDQNTSRILKGEGFEESLNDARTSGFREASGPLRLKSASAGARHRSSRMAGVQRVVESSILTTHVWDSAFGGLQVLCYRCCPHSFKIKSKVLDVI